MRSRGKGWFVNDYGVIYVQGTIDGKFYRKSSGKKETANNIKWIEKNHKEVLLKIIDKDNNSLSKKDSIWFKEFAEEVLRLSADKRNSAGQKDLEGKLQNHIVPYFKNYKLTDIRPLDIDKWQSEKLQELSSGTVQKCKDLMNRTMEKAVANDLVTKNPVRFAESITVIHKKAEPYTELEARLMIEKADGWLKMFLVLAISTGLRTGEVMALKWKDIDFENAYIDLNRSITKGVVTEARGTSTTARGRIKNHERLIELIPDVKNMLANYHMNRPHDEWLFVSKYKEPFKESKSIVNYHFKPLLKKINVTYRELRVTRHTFTSMMLNNGFDKTWVKAMLGHSAKSTVTDEHYYTYKRDDSRLEVANNFFNFNNEKVVKDA